MILSAKYPEIVDKLVVWGANSYVLPEEITAYESRLVHVYNLLCICYEVYHVAFMP